MPGWVAGAAGTFAISAVSAYLFLRLRCRGTGYPLGPRARRWAAAVILITAVVSTGLGVAAVAVSHHLRAAYVGVVVPSGLWLGKASRLRLKRGSLLPESVIACFTFPVRRLDDRMGDDLQDWCDIRSSAVQANPELTSDAAEHYYLQVANLLKDDKDRTELDYWRASIRHKTRTARLAGLDTTPARLRTALASHPSTRDSRQYAADDPQTLARRLTCDADSELNLLLAHSYRLGYRKLVIYRGFKPPDLPRKKRRHTRQSTAQPS